jgi:hypothetical protein
MIWQCCYFIPMPLLIRWCGISGIVINFVAIISQNIDLFLVGQLIASISSFLWCVWLQSKVTMDVIISLTLTMLSIVTKNEYFLYSAMLSRSVSYQFMFERMIKDRKYEN